MKQQDALEQQEAAAPEVIAALGQLSRDVEAPPDFVAQVLARADQAPVRHPTRASWLGRLPWGVDVAVAAVLILAVVGAVPQYAEWFNTYVRGIPSEGEETIGPLRTRGLGSRVVEPTLPLGAWTLNASGDQGSLQIVSVSRQGELRGILDGQEIVGFWDDLAQKIMFVRMMNPARLSTVQLFTGYLFQGSGGLHGEGTAMYTLAGSFEAFAGTGAIASRAVYGWYAQRSLTE